MNREVETGRDTSGSLSNNLDEDEINAKFAIASTFVKETATYISNRGKEVDRAKKALDTEKEKTADERDDALVAQLEQQYKNALIENETWLPGGTGRKVVNALNAAVGGNLSAGATQFVQMGVANYLQQEGASLLGEWTREGKLTEGSPLHAALHGAVGCLGAAAGGGDCGAGGMGAATSSLLTNLFTAQPDETVADKEAKRDIIVGLTTAMALGTNLDPGTAMNSAVSSVDNNYLSVSEAERKAALEYKAKHNPLTNNEAKELADIHELDQDRDQAIRDICTQGNKSGTACSALVAQARHALSDYGKPISIFASFKDLYPQDADNVEDILRGLDDDSILRDTLITEIANKSGQSWDDVASKYDTAMTLHAITSALAGIYGVRSTVPGRYTSEQIRRTEGNVATSSDDVSKTRTSGNTGTMRQNEPSNHSGVDGSVANTGRPNFDPSEIRENAAIFKQYVKEIEGFSNFKLVADQKGLLKDYLRQPNNGLRKLSPQESKAHRWSQTTREDLIKQWEQNTGQQWPRYTQDKLSKRGNVYIRKGEYFDAHEIIPNQYNAPHEWWNIVPAERPNAHQAGIHGSGSGYGKIVDKF